MSPGECGTFALPPEGTPDRQEVDDYRRFLSEVDRRGVPEVAADPTWRPYIDGTGPAPVILRRASLDALTVEEVLAKLPSA